MIVGVPRETKDNEYRVAMVPAGVTALIDRGGHKVLVEQGAGTGSGVSDEDYARAGAEILSNPHEIWAKAELIMKIKNLCHLSISSCSMVRRSLLISI